MQNGSGRRVFEQCKFVITVFLQLAFVIGGDIVACLESWFSQDLKMPVAQKNYDGVLIKDDNLANLFGVNVYDNNEPVSLSGTAQAHIIRADGTTITQNGTVSGNSCSVVLPAEAYEFSGSLKITLKLTSGGSVTTLLNIVARVYP